MAKSLDEIVQEINKKYGGGTASILSSNDKVDVEVISTGSLSVDLAVGVGGLPRGRIIEIYGPESSGKTTLAIQTMVEAQRAGGNVGFVDVEHAFDKEYAEALGLDMDKIVFVQPNCGEDALETMDTMIKSQAFSVIVLDSVAALVPRAELEGEMGESKMGLQARLMSQALRKITASVSKGGACVIFINQLREKIGVLFGSPEVTAGGNALKFYASIRLDIRKSGASLKDKEGNLTGNAIKVKVIKNKVAPPGGIAESVIYFGTGFSREAEICNIAPLYGVLEKSGSWFSYKGNKLANGQEGMVAFLSDNPELTEVLYTEIMKAAFG